MRERTIEFFWDSASPYTYLAATQIETLAARHGAAVVWKPFLLGKAFEATGNRPPATIPAKGKYLFQDLQLWARYYGVPLRFPSVFPVASLTSLRIACALPDADVGVWARAVMTAYWTRDQDIGQPEVLKNVIGELGWDADALLARAQDPAVKDKLRANTDEAIARGVFGAPTFFIGHHMFWGNDRFVLMEAVLAGRLG
ncbi:2-hydroxychromene-2-carboxylate isomerase [Fontimonas thermophila]|uniref:2-hydroxychromene-2-carboxylate isomerase n=1 Tax=Fontimonas thermophila TaxID=1076937 RepID=A0A1I2J8N5_9GAMM|nr:2-hydroxychromene-2-carboxylate isomerase [Fontimonas thermophila]SFF49071.1 2-hydroxychromene-2-carboxylate isomerase [Fontimonas thermophila]